MCVLSDVRCKIRDNTPQVAPQVAPPQRQPLPSHEIVMMYEESPTSDSDMIAFARAVERKHGTGGGE
jgi:hypothetical protein